MEQINEIPIVELTPQKLREQGASVMLEQFDGMVHCFAQLPKLVPDQVTHLIESIASFVNQPSQF